MKAKQTLEKIGDLKITLYLFIILAIFSLLGVVFPQNLPTAKYITTLGTFFGTLVVKTGIRDTFSAWWFNAALFLLLINLTACISTKIWRNLSMVFNVSHLDGPEHFGNFKTHQQIDIALSAEQAAVKAAEKLKKRLYSVNEKNIYKGISIAAKKGKLNKIGSIALHIGVIVLFSGGLVSSKLGFSYHESISVGETVPIKERDFKLRVDNFEMLTNEEGAVKDWISHLTVIENGNEVLHKKIEVNDPLIYKGIYFYQSSYGQDMRAIESALLQIKSPAHKLDTLVTVPFEKPLVLGDLTVTAGSFFGHFNIDTQTRTIRNASFEHRNPALKVYVTSKTGDTLAGKWLFFSHQHFHGHKKDDIQITAKDYVPLSFTGLQIRKNPGVPLIWAGILLMSLGLLAVFYIPIRQIWLFVEHRESGSRLHAAGRSDRFQRGFENEFNRLLQELK